MFDFAKHSFDQAVTVVRPSAAATDGRFSLDEVAALLWRRAWLVIVCGIAALALAVAVLKLLPPAYTAQVQILIDPADLHVVENGVTPTGSLADSGVSTAESQARVISSDSVLTRVVAQLGLQNDPEFAIPVAPEDSWPGLVKGLLGLTPPPDLPKDPALRAVETLRSKIAVRRPERTFVLEVNVKANQSAKAARIANTIADVYAGQEIAARAAFASRASDALTARLGALQAALRNAETKLGKYREDNHLSTANGQLLADQQLGELNQQLTASSLRTAEARVRVNQARQLGGREDSTALPEMLQSPDLRTLRQQRTDLARTNAETLMQFGPKHPVVVEQQAQIRALDAAIDREKARIIDATTKEYDRALASEASIRRELNRTRNESKLNNRALIGARELERDVDTQRAIYEAFLKRARETNQLEHLNTTSMRVISPATPPLGRSWPPSPKFVLPLALVLGLLAGAVLAVLLPSRRWARSGDQLTPFPSRA